MAPNAYGETMDLTWVAGGQYVYKFENCLWLPCTSGYIYGPSAPRSFYLGIRLSY